MELQEVEAGVGNERKKRQRRQAEDHARVIESLPPDMRDNRVVLKKQICAMAGFGVDTLDALWEAGDGPGPRLRVTARHIGVRYCDLIKWLDSRIEA